jgi:hypothetical protein
MEFSEIVLACKDNKPNNLLKNVLWISTDQNQEHLMNWNNKFEILSLLFLLILEERCCSSLCLPVYRSAC